MMVRSLLETGNERKTCNSFRQFSTAGVLSDELISIGLRLVLSADWIYAIDVSDWPGLGDLGSDASLMSIVTRRRNSAPGKARTVRSP